IRKSHPRLPVVMFSQHTQRGAAATMDALAQGANDYVTKPDAASGPHRGLETVREQLLGKIKGFFPTPVLAARPSAFGSIASRPSASGVVSRPALERIATPRVEVVAIGVSTGGPNALAALL